MTCSLRYPDVDVKCGVVLERTEWEGGSTGKGERGQMIKIYGEIKSPDAAQCLGTSTFLVSSQNWNVTSDGG